MLPKLLPVALFLVLAPAALASNTWYVDGVNGNDTNNCLSPQTACKTIGHVISLASSGDTIMVAPATYAENLTIKFSLKIIGSDATTTIVDGNQAGTVITIKNAKAHVVLSNLTIRNGYNQTGDGGGISNIGTLTVNNSTITFNRAYTGGGAIFNSAPLTINHSTFTGNALSYEFGVGGAILNFSVLTINKSTISGNDGYYGGGIWSGCGSGKSSVTTINDTTISGNSGAGIEVYCGTAAINNSTLTGNWPNEYPGGGIWNEMYGTLTINNSTISGNNFGGIRNDYGSVTLQNTIIANNPHGANCINTMTSNGYNLSSDNTCNFNGPGDMNNTAPKLEKLGNYGGPTQTMRLRVGSPAVDAGNPNGCTDSHGNLLKTDQRGKPRPDPGDPSGCDIGAYERQKN